MSLASHLPRLLAFSFAGADLLLETGRDCRILFVAGAAENLTGQSESKLVGQALDSLFAEEDRAFVRGMINGLGSGERIGPLAVRLNGAEGQARSAVLGLCCLPDNPGLVHCTLSLRGVQSLVQSSAPRDPESQLLQGSAFPRAVEQALQHARELDQTVAMTLLDLDGLGQLRSELEASDSRLLLDRVCASLRASSLDGQTVARLSENRFGLVHQAGLSGQEMVRRLTSALRQSHPMAGKLSVEGAMLPLESRGLEKADMIRAIAYAAERFASSGRIPGEDLPGVIENSVRETLERMEDFRQVLAQRRFHFLYQPVVRLVDRRPAHFELLVRFEEEVSPQEKLDFAENLGLICDFDLAVCHHAVNVLSHSKCDPRLKLAVNLSGHSILNSVFVKSLDATLRANKAVSRRLAFEITESAELTDLETAHRVIQTIRMLGYRVFLDDFGAGAASFRYLSALAVDGIKIDGRYIRELGRAPRDLAMLRGLKRICDDLEIDIVAERVETETQAARLRELGLPLAQGWLFGKPAAKPRLGREAEADMQAEGMLRGLRRFAPS
ncbi:sensor domain-containing phosphodiesterase [Fodinicurvata fenggangensis]|uniref:sensor domain-containing phosphodiesterase n=1 Tax=Fodinicurvata fenggangensis TaxID=1121830 RepID=UPI00068DCDD7|nr:EAL domain-containing protein [Fodinicurvata fenggangensis]